MEHDDWFAETMTAMLPAPVTKKKVSTPTKKVLIQHRTQKQMFIRIENQTPYKWTVEMCAMREEDKRQQTPLMIKHVLCPGQTLDEYLLTFYMDSLLLVQSVSATCTLEDSEVSTTQMSIRQPRATKRTYFQINEETGDNLHIRLALKSIEKEPHKWLVAPALNYYFCKRDKDSLTV